MSWKGQVALEGTLYFLFTTRQFSTGAPYTLAGTPVLSVYEENNTTQITAGVSVSADYDSVTGLNQATVVATAANGYESGKRYDVVITTGTVDSVSVVGEVVGSFQVGPVSADLVADTITAAKFDESTAFPVKSADSGATQIARTGADADTLETLSDEIAAISAGSGTPGGAAFFTTED